MPSYKSFKRACARSRSCDWAASLSTEWVACWVCSHELSFATTAAQNGVSPRPTCILLSGNLTSYTYMGLSVYPILYPQRNLKDLLWSTGWSLRLSCQLCRPQLELRRRSWLPRRPPQTPQPRGYVKTPWEPASVHAERLLISPTWVTYDNSMGVVSSPYGIIPTRTICHLKLFSLGDVC